MPLHDWTRVPAGLFHHFHQSWSIRIVDALNAGLLPSGAIALVEQRSGPVEADVLAIETTAQAPRLDVGMRGGLALQEPLVATFTQRTDRALYAARANRIIIRHHLGRIIAVIEIVSPGNKDSRNAVQRFVEKTIDFLDKGVHVLVVDLFPPTARDPRGLHQLIWDYYNETDSFTFPPGHDRLLASYERGIDLRAYLKSLAVSQLLPDMPLFLTTDLSPNLFVSVPLESTYTATWNATPREFRTGVENGVPPDGETSG